METHLPAEAGPGSAQSGTQNKDVFMVTLKNELVEFLFYRPDAQQVHLAGDFNDWRLDDVLMTRREDGYWGVEVSLPAGEFKFRYCADGEWFTDYAAFGVEPGRFGLDSVVRVPHQPLKVIEPAAIRQTAAA